MSARLATDRASVKYLGMVVSDPSGRIGLIVATRYNGDTRICRVLYHTGTPLTQWHPGIDLAQVSEVTALEAGFNMQPRVRGKATRYDW